MLFYSPEVKLVKQPLPISSLSLLKTQNTWQKLWSFGSITLLLFVRMLLDPINPNQIVIFPQTQRERKGKETWTLQIQMQNTYSTSAKQNVPPHKHNPKHIGNLLQWEDDSNILMFFTSFLKKLRNFFKFWWLQLNFSFTME